MGTTKAEYPKWKYHPKEAPRLVLSEEEDEALGEMWFESPAEAEEHKPKRGRPPKSKGDD